MEENRKEQIEALEVLVDFNERLVKNIRILVKELSGERLDDTDNFIKGIVDAMRARYALRKKYLISILLLLRMRLRRKTMPKWQRRLQMCCHVLNS